MSSADNNPSAEQLPAEHFRSGTEAMLAENWDQAIELFEKATTLVPDNVLFRQTLWGCIRKKNGPQENQNGTSQ